ncbi:MAG: hypothetical protein KKC76_18840 [Proteobacteria bacterium]|nr:hypothetical protein [Pseudomonadota bacterium]MBU4295266.1 hypothetical protein [Pseudomonadota bacterium]MCG2750202.1 hypothetical protein [Desulfobulbaceae bacterium]
MRTCVTPQGDFLYCIHEPAYAVKNLRESDLIEGLGTCDGREYLNNRNFPPADVIEEKADRVYEIPNVFPFKGTTFINSPWADATAKDPLRIKLPAPVSTSFSQNVNAWLAGRDDSSMDGLFNCLPESVLLALATTSTDPDDLVRLAKISCEFIADSDGVPSGLLYSRDPRGMTRAVIKNHPLFEAVANNPFLPDPYKQAMVLRPGAQGGSEIVGEWTEAGHHVFEYLRRNSYIPWGHYAANMANDALRYDINRLSLADMTGLRHLYYQRTYVRMAADLGMEVQSGRKSLTAGELESLRREICRRLDQEARPPFFDCTLWGWNYGFDFAPSHYRLNASHQQIHQQFALLPAAVTALKAGTKTDEFLPSYGCGDLVADCVRAYADKHDRSLFADLITCIRHNRRLDGTKGEASLVVFEDDEVMLFVPKAQTSQWELQLMTLRPVGNILEADEVMRRSLDGAMHTAMQVLGGLGLRMANIIEYAKRFTDKSDQRLIYSFLPKLPESPGAFSEAQLRWIMGHYPEDFAIACRSKLP